MLLILLCGRAAGLALYLPPRLSFALVILCWLAALTSRILNLRSTSVENNWNLKSSILRTTPLLFAAVFFLGLFQENSIHQTDVRLRNQAMHLSGRPATSFRGTLAGMPDRRGYSIQFEVHDVFIRENESTIHFPGRILVQVAGPAAAKAGLAYAARGDCVLVHAPLHVPSSSRNPTLFHHRAFLERRGCFLIARVGESDRIELQEPDGRPLPWHIFMRGMASFQRGFHDSLNHRVSPDNGAILCGLLLGKSYDMAPSDREMFLKTGLLHLFAVSGLHTGMVAFLFLLFLRIAGLSLPRSAVVVMVFVWLFAAFTGFRPPVVRAGIMISCLLASWWMPGLRRPIEGISALAFAAFWVLILNPRALHQLDFQFSYMAVFFLIVFDPFVKEYLLLDTQGSPSSVNESAHPINKWILRPLATVFIVQMGLVPLMAIYYQRMSLSAFLANPVTIPIAFLCLIGGLVHTAAGMTLPVVQAVTGPLLNGMTGILRHVVRLLADLPFSMIHVPAMPWFICGLYYLVILGGNWILERREWKPRRGVFFAMAVFAIVGLIIWLPIVLTTHWDLQMFFLDVGQGDSTYVEFHDGTNMLIDGGRHYPRDMGTTVVRPFLENRGVDYIDILAATHADSDHIGGLLALPEHFEIGMAVIGAEDNASGLYRELISSLYAWGVPIVRLKKGDVMNYDNGNRTEILNPPDTPPVNWDRNDCSLVMRIMRGGSPIVLFMGDAGEKVEAALVEKRDDVRAAVLKVGHHGSNGATTIPFIEAVAPVYAVISAGERNPFGHPSPAVLERLQQHNVRIYRTDRDAAVIMRVRGDRIWTETMASGN